MSPQNLSRPGQFHHARELRPVRTVEVADQAPAPEHQDPVSCDRRAWVGDGFLLKDVPADQLVEGIRLVASGEALLAPSVTRRLISEFSRVAPAERGTPPDLEELTPRELEVLLLIARGYSNAEIADELIVSSTTVKTHVARILLKLDLRDRVQAVVRAYESGLVAPGRP